jgi:hypothetical protein
MTVTNFTAKQGPYKYIVAVSAYNIGTGNQVIVRTCGHQHRTLSGAERCHRDLTKRQPGGVYRADFWGAEVLHADGSRLTRDESYEFMELQAPVAS